MKTKTERILAAMNVVSWVAFIGFWALHPDHIFQSGHIRPGGICRLFIDQSIIRHQAIQSVYYGGSVAAGEDQLFPVWNLDHGHVLRPAYGLVSGEGTRTGKELYFSGVYIHGWGNICYFTNI